jgi:chromosome segregation ATPase
MITPDGTPSGFGRLDQDSAAKKKPYGDVQYADPGYQKDGVARYPVDTEAHARAAWSYVNQESNARKYSPENLAKVRRAILAALKRFGVQVQMADSENPEGGTSTMSVSTEAHEALLAKAVAEAKAQEKEAFDAELAGLQAKIDELTRANEAASAELTSLREEAGTSAASLETAQIELKKVTDELEAIKAETARLEAERAKSELAAARADEVRKLDVFTEEFVTERAALWAELSDEAWAARTEEWKSVRTAPKELVDSASLIKGTADVKPSQPNHRRVLLGLE